MSQVNKIKILSILFSILFAFISLRPALADGIKKVVGLNYAENVGLTNAEEEDPRDMAVTIIQYLITFLGLISVGVILYGGFIWMTAGGNDERLNKAKSIIVTGTIGLIIILSAFAIVSFVVTMTDNALKGEIN